MGPEFLFNAANPERVAVGPRRLHLAMRFRHLPVDSIAGSRRARHMPNGLQRLVEQSFVPCDDTALVTGLDTWSKNDKAR